jgi:arginine-tRNA-protein transferase
MPGSVYDRFMDAGFRRSGMMIYQPVCTGCRECKPIRVPVDRFRPDKSQRRCVRRNADLIVTVTLPELSDEKFQLYRRYVTEWHERSDSELVTLESLDAFLYRSPVDTLEFCYRDQAGKLLAVGIADVSRRVLSSVYFYFDPDESDRGLGTFGALYEIHWARSQGIKHYYLGFVIRECRQMSYKSVFKPYHLLEQDGTWREE